jgi:parallel beta-helix repeat protein
MENTRFVQRLVVMLLGGLGIALASVTSAQAIACGDVLGPGGRFRLEQDVACPNAAFTVRDGAILDLNGYSVTCGLGTTTGCIVLTGAGAQLWNGTVDGGTHDSIVLAGTGEHTVRNVTSTFPVDRNILVLSDNNRLINVTAESGFHAAFAIRGNNNVLENNTAICFALFGSNIGCIEVWGDGNRLIENFATSTVDTSFASGFLIEGNNNLLRGNQAIDNEGRGIVVTGIGNVLRANTALNNALDLQDTNGDCANNTWRRNTFETSDPACIR